MQLFMDFMHAQGYKKCYLLTSRELTQAAALYRSFGFVLTEEQESMDLGKPQLVQRYELVLTE